MNGTEITQRHCRSIRRRTRLHLLSRYERIHTITANVLWENGPMKKVFRRLGLKLKDNASDEAPTVEFTFLSSCGTVLNSALTYCHRLRPSSETAIGEPFTGSSSVSLALARAVMFR